MKIRFFYLLEYTIWNINFARKTSGIKCALIHNFIPIIITFQLTNVLNKENDDGYVTCFGVKKGKM